MAPDAYAFKAMSADDLPTICRWLAAPHVAEWWGDPEQQFALVSGDLSAAAMSQYIVTIDGRPFAYLQSYDPAVWPQGGLGPQPSGTRGIDQFIGDLAMMDRGPGSAFIRIFVDRLLAGGAPRAVTDPSPQNGRAIRAYEKAGFQRQRMLDTPDGPALLMVRDA